MYVMYCMISKQMEEARSMMNELRHELRSHVLSLRGVVNGVRGCMTTAQMGRFCTWINNNEWVVHMLNTLWDEQSPVPNGTL
jgi:hypothetical protein